MYLVSNIAYEGISALQINVLQSNINLYGVESSVIVDNYVYCKLEWRCDVLLLKYARIFVNTELQTFQAFFVLLSEFYKICEAARHALRRITLPES